MTQRDLEVDAEALAHQALAQHRPRFVTDETVLRDVAAIIRGRATVADAPTRGAA